MEEEEEEEKEEEDISEGVMPMFIMCPSDVGVETFDLQPSREAPEIRPWLSGTPTTISENRRNEHA